MAVAALLRRAARRVALDDEELGLLGIGRRTVRELSRKIEPVRNRRLARDLSDRRAARLAGARREDDAPDDRCGKRGVFVEPLLERRPHRAVDLRRDLGVVEPVLRLTLELRLEDVRGEKHDEALADVLGRDGDALREKLVRLDIVAHGLRHARTEPVLVRAAGRSRNAVHIRAHVLLGGFGPDQGELEAGLALAREVEGAARRALPPLRHDAGEPVREAALVRHLFADRGLLRLVEEHDAEAAMEIRLGLEPLADLLGVENELPEDLDVGPEANRRARAAHFLTARGLLDPGGRLALRVRLRPLVPVPPHDRRHLRREGADDG